MKNFSKFLKKFSNLLPSGFKPKFITGNDLLRWHQEQGVLYSASIIRDNKATKIQRMFSRSGIRELYINCSFNNYQIEHEGHKKVLHAAHRYAKEFNDNISSFVFLGNPGTGKNHLAAAICNYLILRNKSVLIVTVADLMSSMKSTFNVYNNLSEEYLLRNFSTVDLLIIDEIGVQIQSRYEKIVINQIVDRRSSSKKSTGMLSNLNYLKLRTLLGKRVIDRMCLGKGLWLNFNWSSYRKKVNVNEC
ncbi:DNA replication protein DnaC [Candidatus Purcelliella pentastirinorum]|nr:DNA replication protein DnaC [Candidatus Purcelliella pentastirinorum]WDI79087.1 DNA replication protein DnaC [Candidatus Purcelliella pentastirinorum]WDR80226.1 DNA replication protein DnaC [Candidatus Purcelliella pentastirinorum]